MFRDKKSNFAQKVFQKTGSEAWTGFFITLALVRQPSLYSRLIRFELKAAGEQNWPHEII